MAEARCLGERVHGAQDYLEWRHVERANVEEMMAEK